MNTPNQTFRYPGLASFTTAQRDLFYGRKKETRELFNLISVEKTVVLFSKSGYGKTSLLNAGVVPMLEQDLIFPVPIRFGDESRNPEQHFSEQFDEAYNKFLGIEKRGKDSSATETAWEQVKRSPFIRNGVTWRPLIIFDQFEELFTLYLSEKTRSRFVSDLADMIQERLPVQVREKLLQELENEKISFAEIAEMEKAPPMKFVFSIRSDMLHFMDELSGQIPYILRSRYQLFGLDAAAAKDAILLPAALPQDGRFKTKPFGYTPEAVDEIIAAISKNREVESFQLQVVCQALEEEIDRSARNKIDRTANLPKNADGLPLINPDFYEGQKGIENILERSYYRRLETFPDEADRQTARYLLEDDLVNENARRRSVDIQDLLQRKGVTQDLLNTLEQQRLLRKEPRLDSFYYEISHDTLLAPIVKSRNERKEKEEKERLAREAAEQEARNKALQAQVEREQSLRQKAKNTTIFAVAVAVLALLAAVFGYVQMQTAKQKEQEAVKTQENAENEKNKATENFEKYLNGQRIMEAQKWLQSGDSYFGFGKTEEAKNSYKKGIDIMESKDSYKKDIDVMESNQSDILYQELIEKWNRCK